MADKDLGKALLSVAAPAAEESEARTQARRVVRRDKWIVRVVSGLTVLLWLAALAGVLFVVWIAVCFIFPRHEKIARDLPLIPAEQLAEVQRNNLLAWEICLEVIAASFIALTLAALCTVWLILWSRRATLREVNASLVAISEQLRLLQSNP